MNEDGALVTTSRWIFTHALVVSVQLRSADGLSCRDYKSDYMPSRFPIEVVERRVEANGTINDVREWDLTGLDWMRQ